MGYRRALALCLALALTMTLAGCASSSREQSPREESAPYQESEPFGAETAETAPPAESAEPAPTEEPALEGATFLERYGLEEYANRVDRNSAMLHLLGQDRDGGWYAIERAGEEYLYEFTLRSEKYYGEREAFETAAYDIEATLCETELSDTAAMSAAAAFFHMLENPRPEPEQPEDAEDETPAPEELDAPPEETPPDEEMADYIRAFGRKYADYKAVTCTLRMDLGTYRSAYGRVAGDEVREAMGVALSFALVDRASGTVFFPEDFNGDSGHTLSAVVTADGQDVTISAVSTASYEYYDAETGDYPAWEELTPEEILESYDHIGCRATMTLTALVPADYDGAVFYIGPSDHETEAALAGFAGRTAAFGAAPGYDSGRGVFISVENAQEHSVALEEETAPLVIQEKPDEDE